MGLGVARSDDNGVSLPLPPSMEQSLSVDRSRYKRARRRRVDQQQKRAMRGRVRRRVGEGDNVLWILSEKEARKGSRGRSAPRHATLHPDSTDLIHLVDVASLFTVHVVDPMLRIFRWWIVCMCD
jgi:hypothetical protein